MCAALCVWMCQQHAIRLCSTSAPAPRTPPRLQMEQLCPVQRCIHKSNPDPSLAPPLAPPRSSWSREGGRSKPRDAHAVHPACPRAPPAPARMGCGSAFIKSSMPYGRAMLGRRCDWFGETREGLLTLLQRSHATLGGRTLALVTTSEQLATSRRGCSSAQCGPHRRLCVCLRGPPPGGPVALPHAIKVFLSRRHALLAQASAGTTQCRCMPAHLASSFAAHIAVLMFVWGARLAPGGECVRECARACICTLTCACMLAHVRAVLP